MSKMAPVAIEGDSAEAVAYALLRDLVAIAKREDEDWRASRDWLLETYIACLRAVRLESVLDARTIGQQVIPGAGDDAA